MNSLLDFLRSLSFGLSREIILIITLGIICLVLLILIIHLNMRMSRLLKGSGTVSLEDSVQSISKDLKDLIEFRAGSEEYLTTVEKRLRNSVQAIETVRFNAFKGTGAGGNQSFASALINENGDGVVISTLYSSDRMSIFAKPISKFNTQFELTDEEKTVLTNASNRLTK